MKELIFGLIGGTALLMYGVDKMGEGLEKASGEMMKTILTVLTGKVWSAFLVGILITALVQSSTAVTVLTVGFVNAGLMKLPQAIGIIYGANIGTTITAQLMAFSFKFKLTDIALPVLGIGFGISYFSKKENLRHIGDAIMGFGMMFLGLKILNSGVPFIQNSTTLKYFFETYASIPIIGVALGMFATAMVHSSSATIGLVMVLGQAGLIDLKTSICIMLGDNIGTCITAQLASLTGNINARRTAWAHTLFNLIGVSIVALILPWFVKIVDITTIYLQPAGDLNSKIANSHTIFNVLSAMIFLPITNYYVKFLEYIIRDKHSDEIEFNHLDRLLLDTPIAAFKASISEISKSLKVAKRMFQNVMNSFYNSDESTLPLVKQDESLLNEIQKEITSYIVDISKVQLTETQSVMVPAMINSINHIERAGDHANEMAATAKTKLEKNLTFTEEGISELKALEKLVLELFDYAEKSLIENNKNYISIVQMLEDKVDAMSKEILNNHIKRLETGECKIDSGVIFVDIVNHFENIADHIYKVCLSVSNNITAVTGQESAIRQ